MMTDFKFLFIRPFDNSTGGIIIDDELGEIKSSGGFNSIRSMLSWVYEVYKDKNYPNEIIAKNMYLCLKFSENMEFFNSFYYSTHHAEIIKFIPEFQKYFLLQ